MADQKDKVVLAYSGGLDTSCCIKWLQVEKNLDVIAVVGDVGQEHEGLEKIKQKALKSGALECIVVDMRQTFVQEYLSKALAANAMYENKYPLVSALSRPLISKHLVDAAHAFGAKYIAHGCTGKGNDQVRFEASITMLDPDLEILYPGARMGSEDPPRGNGIGPSSTASRCPPPKNPRTPSTTTCGAGQLSAACSKTRGRSLRRTSMP